MNWGELGKESESDPCSALSPQSADLGGGRHLVIYGTPLGMCMGLSAAAGEGGGAGLVGGSLAHEAVCWGLVLVCTLKITPGLASRRGSL